MKPSEADGLPEAQLTGKETIRVGKADETKIPKILYLYAFLCGVSVFPRTEGTYDEYTHWYNGIEGLIF